MIESKVSFAIGFNQPEWPYRNTGIAFQYLLTTFNFHEKFLKGPGGNCMVYCFM